MALTQEQLDRLRAANAAKAGTQPVQEAAPSAPPQENALFRAASFVNRGVEKFANLPGIKQVGQATGAALGGVGGVIGGGVAAVGTPIVNIAKGRPVFENYGAQIKKNAMDTGRFGFQLGEQVPTLAAMQTLGRVPNLVLGAAQTVEGAKQTADAVLSGDTAGAIQAGVTTGIGAAGTILGLKQKGLIFDEAVSKPVTSRIASRMPNKQAALMSKYEGIMQDVLQPGKAVAKREAKSLLSMDRKARAGMSVEPRKTTARVLVEEKIIPKTVEESGITKFDTTDNVVDLDRRVEVINDKLEEALALDPNPQFNLERKKFEAARSVDDLKNVSATDKKAMKAEIERFFDDEIETRGQYVNGEQYNQVKRGFSSMGDYKNLSPGQKHIRQVAESIAQDIEKAYADKFDVKAVNRSLGDMISARNELQTLHGTVVRGGGLGKKLAQLGGMAIGGSLSSIPIVDNIVGAYVAGKIQQAAVSPARRLSGMSKLDIQSPVVSTLEDAATGSQEAAMRQSALPRLPAPREPMPGPLADYKPSKSGLLSQEEAMAALRGTVLDPARTGQNVIVLPEVTTQATLPGRTKRAKR